MLEDRVQKLVSFFQNIEQGKKVNLNEVVKEYLLFFEELKERLQSATPEEKRQLFLIMNDIYAKMLAESQKLAQRSGLSEEQLLQLAENPNNFSQEQWELLQNTKKSLTETSRDITKTLVSSKKPEPKSSVSNNKKPRKGRSNWLKS